MIIALLREYLTLCFGIVGGFWLGFQVCRDAEAYKRAKRIQRMRDLADEGMRKAAGYLIRESHGVYERIEQPPAITFTRKAGVN